MLTFTFTVAVDSPRTRHSPENCHNHLYFAFCLQILMLNMIPHNIAKAYLVRKMQTWSERRVKNFDNGLFLVHSVMVLLIFIFSLFTYHSGVLMKAVPDSGSFVQITLILLYCYLVYWSIIGFIVCLIGVVWVSIWLCRCPAHLRQ